MNVNITQRALIVIVASLCTTTSPGHLPLLKMLTSVKSVSAMAKLTPASTTPSWATVAASTVGTTPPEQCVKSAPRIISVTPLVPVSPVVATPRVPLQPSVTRMASAAVRSGSPGASVMFAWVVTMALIGLVVCPVVAILLVPQMPTSATRSLGSVPVRTLEGRRCDQCKAGFMGVTDVGDIERPRQDNEFGCTPCFCYEHSNVCHASENYVKAGIKSTFGEGDEGWGTVGGGGVDYDPLSGRISSDNGFDAPERYQGPNRFSYNQKISFDLALKEDIDAVDGGHVSIKGINKFSDVVKVTAPLDLKQTTDKQSFSLPLHEKHFLPENNKPLDAKEFIELLNAVTEIQIVAGPSHLDNVNLETAELAYNSENPDAEPATWIESCIEPKYAKSSLETCSPGFTRDHSNKGMLQLYRDCVECDCNKHNSPDEPCDPRLVSVSVATIPGRAL